MPLILSGAQLDYAKRWWIRILIGHLAAQSHGDRQGVGLVSVSNNLDRLYELPSVSSASAGLTFRALAKRADHKGLLSRLVQHAVSDSHEPDLGIRAPSAET